MDCLRSIELRIFCDPRSKKSFDFFLNENSEFAELHFGRITYPSVSIYRSYLEM
ncbi:hypothetical protein LEP1GSC060_3762 [Leptospira weilii serovar Ranarum str. ICFT]|uniref:Uncharacterized protein n=1 Tax=Leptospira weilii serovar Ranarum str. ICFT TaxID=1218598 RepID=N1WI47_9LEPT|nr:hypothetical protein LEP1GSC060_3762 [Leptospira weilii serovar Ranarum str. ICFT]